MIAQADIIQFSEIVNRQKENDVFFNRLYTVLCDLTSRQDSYFNTHRDVDWSNSHTQHSKHEKYDRE